MIQKETASKVLSAALKGGGNFAEVANDLRFVPFGGAIGTPAIRVDNVTVAGAE